METTQLYAVGEHLYIELAEEALAAGANAQTPDTSGRLAWASNSLPVCISRDQRNRLSPVTTSFTAWASKLSVLVAPQSIREWFRRRVLRPLLDQLRGGVTPRRLAWSLALGLVVGINPTVGLTTLAVILLAWMFGLSQLASQIGCYAAAPLHLLLFLPFIELGVYLFHTGRLPMSRRQFEHLMHHPLRLFHAAWRWEWHALVVWGMVAAIAMPLLAMYLRRALVLLMRRHKTLMRSRPALH